MGNNYKNKNRSHSQKDKSSFRNKDSRSEKNSGPHQKQNTEIGYVKPREITQEMQESYIDYAMSVIVSRALPDVRDGLKPVHRRILYAMYEDGLRHNAKLKKSASVIGSVLAKYHPHGDMSVYDALVRMAQDFSLRYPLVQGQGNFGCFTKDTKVKLTDGRDLSFGELVKEQEQGKRHWTFSFNPRRKSIEIAEIKSPRLTKKKVKIMEVNLGNGEKIRCTLDHKFMLRDGSYREAKDLNPGDSLMPLYIEAYNGKEDRNLKGYVRVFQPVFFTWDFIHHLADKWNLRNEIYQRKAGRVRHHKDFNKLNNNPDNILRIQWQDHWKYHKEIASKRHKSDPEYVKKIAEGRRKFWAKKENRKLRSQLQAERNRKMWQSPKYRKMWIDTRKKIWQEPKYKESMRKVSSENLKRLWRRKNFQGLMSRLKSKEMKNRWQDEKYREFWREEMREISIKIWSDPKHREHISKIMKEKFFNPELRKRISQRSKLLWKDPSYRAKYPKDHFRKIAKKLWEGSEIREFHRQKAINQWKDPVFREKVIKAIETRSRQRVKENPEFMKELSEKAKTSLRKKWQNPSYKNRVIKSKILKFVSGLLNKYPKAKVTSEVYENERRNNGVPKAQNALVYFNDFSEIVKEAKNYNHKVVGIRILKEKSDVYDLTCEPWHNFALSAGIFVHNSIDGDSAAAYRYTECRLSKIGEETLRDIEKNTIDFVDNYDGTRKEPIVLPSPLPQLLLNGSLGIAVGMATNIPPHNLSEVVTATIYLIDNPKATTEDLFKFVKGPDFPTGGSIFSQRDIVEAYSQGKGPIVTRGKAEIIEKEKTGGFKIIITEIPYQVQKSNLIEQFAHLVQEKKIEGVKDIRDESDKEGMRIVIELQRDAYPKKILNRLYKFTDFQRTFHLNMLTLTDGIQPRVLNLAEVLSYFILHRKEVIYRRTKYDLNKAKERAHILEGLHKCLANIDLVIKIIKGSASREDAQKNLIKRFRLTDIQANAILETKLSALAKLERKKIEDELKEQRARIRELSAILKSPQKVKEVIKKELEGIKKEFGDERKTKVYVQKVGEIAEEDLIPQQDTIITLTKGGYIKRINPAIYKKQKRGGKGILGMKTVGEDIVEHFLTAKTHDSLLFFTDSGKVFRTMVYEIPEGNRVAKGRGLLNFLEISPQEKVFSLHPIGKEDEELGIKYLVMVTKNGIIKKTALKEFKNVRRSGLIAMSLRKGDALCEVQKTTGEDELILATKKGQSIRFKEKDIRPMGRTAAGIRGIRLRKEDEVIGMEVIKNQKPLVAEQSQGTKQPISKAKSQKLEKRYLLVVTENGYGKRTDIKEYRLQSRGGSGIKTAQVNQKTGNLIALKVLSGKEEDLIIISRKGQVIRVKIGPISKMSRSTQGVRIMKLDEGDKVASAACI